MSNLLLQAQKHLQAHGGRMTLQRRIILETLDDLTDHPTADELYILARKADPNINLSTVYRTLRWLQTENLVQSRFFEEERHPERFDSMAPEEHHHFICTTCRKVIEFDSDLVNSLKQNFQNETGATIRSGSLILYGTCAQCASIEECE
jgi:Fur family transcriptional regulator, ferric uptake regulator